MAISFPSSPSTGQKFTHGNKVWTWDGNSWKGGVTAGGDAGTLDSLNSTQFLRSDTDTSTTGDVGIGLNAPDSPLHIKKTGANVTLLTLENYQSDIGGLSNQGNYIDFKMTDDNETATPQVRIGMHVYDSDGTDSGQPSEGNGNFLIYTMEGTDALGNGNLTEKLRVTEKGNVGIGTSSPSEKLHIKSGGNAYKMLMLESENGDAGLLLQGQSGNQFSIQQHSSQRGLFFYDRTAGQYRIFIDPDGEVGIGTSNPRSKLEVHGDGTTLRLDGTGNTTRRIFFRGTSTSNPAEMYADGTLRLWTEDAGTDIKLEPADDILMNPGGNVNIGGSAGSMKLNVNGDIYLGDNSAITNGLYGGGNVVVSSDNDVLIIGDGNTSSPSASNKITIGWGNTANINYDSLSGAALNSLSSPAVVTAEFYTDHAKMLKQLQLLNSSSNPSAPKTGAIYYNTTDDTVKVYNGTEWIDVGAPPMNATGGTVATYTVGGQSYRSHTFTSSGTFTPTATGTVDVMVVAGGGCGGRDNAGGGGAGGVRQNTNVVVTPSSYTIVVGAGGAANTNDNGGNGGTGFNGGNSSAISITSLGGGFGGSAGTDNASGQNRANGGSGGGGCGAESTRTGGSGTAGQGNNGGDGHPTNGGGGGGGGAGAVGTGYSGTNDGGHGGIGIQNDYRTGSNVYYGGGGGAGNNNSIYTIQPGGSGGGGDGGDGGQAGSANTGGGGGGHTHPATIISGAGGSGIVVIRYPI